MRALATAVFVVSSLCVASSVHADAMSADDCLDYEDDETVRYRCGPPATVAFCILSSTMKPGATKAKQALARSLSCTRSARMHDPCTMRGPGNCDSARRRARVLDIADIDALWGVCEGVNEVPRYEGRGRFGCPTAAMGERSRPADADAEFSKDEVREVQVLLAWMGYAPGPPDGEWGPLTGEAYRRFSSDAGLAVTEVLTAQVLGVLREAALSGDEVREAQGLLAEGGYAPGPVDGLWGPRTDRAFRSFLRDAGLPEKPVLPGPALDALREAVSLGRNAGPRDARAQSRTAFSGESQAPGRVRQERSAIGGVAQPLCAVMAHPGRCWMELAAPARCYMWLEGTPPSVTVLAVTWSGRCRDGKASGAGERRTRYAVRNDASGATESEVLDEGAFVDGRAHGRWSGVHKASETRFTIDYVNGEVRREEVRDTRRGTCTVSAFDDAGKLIGSQDC